MPCSPRRSRPPVGLVLLLLVSCGSSSGSSGGDQKGGGGGPPVTFVPIVSPAPAHLARFGETMLALDVDGDGGQEVALGAPGEGGVYLAERIPGDEPGWTVEEVLTAEGAGEWPIGAAADRFGGALAAAQLDDDPEEELVVGAPDWGSPEQEPRGAVFVFGLRPDRREPVRIDTPWGEASLYGTSVAAGDFDGDGHVDLAVGAPWVFQGHERAGAVHVLFGPFDAEGGSAAELQVLNPYPVTDGNFGVHLATRPDVFGDELVVSAMGNDSSGGVPLAGQVFRYLAPFDVDAFLVLEDPNPVPADPPRFGMHIAARDGLVAIGAPRKDIGGVVDSGLGFGFQPSGASRSFLHDHPAKKDILGFRCGLGDFIDGPEIDYAFLSLKRALFLWSGADPAGPSALEVPQPPEGGDHFGTGFGVAQLVPGGREEILVGDPTWNRPGFGAKDDAGRGGVLVFD